MASAYVSCVSCRRDFKTSKLKRGMCEKCRSDQDFGQDFDVHDQELSPADQHDAEYNGPRVVEMDDD